MTDEQMKEFLIELTRLSRKHEIELMAEDGGGYGDCAPYIDCVRLYESEIGGCYVVDNNGYIVFTGAPELLTGWGKPRVIGRPPEDRPAVDSP